MPRSHEAMWHGLEVFRCFCLYSRGHLTRDLSRLHVRFQKTGACVKLILSQGENFASKALNLVPRGVGGPAGPVLLCRLVMQVLDAEYKLHNDGKSINLDGNAEATVTLCWRTAKQLLGVQHNDNLWRIGVKLTSLGCRGIFETKLMIELFNSGENPELMFGRACGENKGCKTSFRTKFEHPAAEFVYGIDFNDMQLKKLAEGDQYCALSYVWGKKLMYLLKRGNLEKLMSTNSIAEINYELPLTIVDAMRLDDNEHKAEVIGKMHLVYSKAEITIVAVSESDSFYGLPGYGRNPRDVPQPVRRVGKDGLVLGVRPRYQ
ncbi:hypothetical protein B0H63DRAFT_450121 [Podospora didyma]|uniref:Uncharacterized protein n=1 Tax=Podospora didyma TaxID=330526 RepID=A0AAE0U0J3_9PEZI|nr:hypothetical protein B0H63DRAFT_450121 [Podospora didyma]